MTRERVIEIARGQLGHVGSEKYWLGVNGHHPGSKFHWCGVFALWCLRQVRLTDAEWITGRGFVGPLGLPQTLSPQPGDIGYIHTPYQHHCVIEHADASTVRSIDGNSVGDSVLSRERPRSAFTAFYSIQPLLDRAPTQPKANPIGGVERAPEVWTRTPFLRGADVERWQRQLASEGFYAGTIDGICGPKTVSAILTRGITWIGDDGHS